MKQPKWKSVLRPVAQQFADSIRKLSDEDLLELMVARDSVTTMNCWWVEYHVSKAAGDYAENELQLRQERAASCDRSGEAIETRSGSTEGESAVGAEGDETPNLNPPLPGDHP